MKKLIIITALLTASVAASAQQTVTAGRKTVKITKSDSAYIMATCKNKSVRQVIASGVSIHNNDTADYILAVLAAKPKHTPHTDLITKL